MMSTPEASEVAFCPAAIGITVSSESGAVAAISQCIISNSPRDRTIPPKRPMHQADTRPAGVLHRPASAWLWRLLNAALLGDGAMLMFTDRALRKLRETRHARLARA